MAYYSGCFKYAPISNDSFAFTEFNKKQTYKITIAVKVRIYKGKCV